MYMYNSVDQHSIIILLGLFDYIASLTDTSFIVIVHVPVATQGSTYLIGWNIC